MSTSATKTPKAVASFSSHRYFLGTPPLALPSPAAAVSIPRRRRLLLHRAATSALRKTPIPISDSVERVLSGQVWQTCFNTWWRWLSRLISFYLLLSLNLSLVASASASPPPSTTHYPCEDISDYYSQVKRLSGEALKKKLNTIIAPHHSLSYHQVWDALKFLDAADVDHPESSLGIVEIYSLRVVPTQLSGKPQGWNSE